MSLNQDPLPVIGAVEIYSPQGMRSISVAGGEDLLLAAMKAHDIWEESGERLRIRVVRFLGDGESVCICHLVPNGEAWSDECLGLDLG